MSEERPELYIATELPPEVGHLAVGYMQNPAARLQTYESLDVSGDSQPQRQAAEFRDHQKELFVAGEIRNPILNVLPKLQTERRPRRHMYNSLTVLELAQDLRKKEGAIATLEDRMVDGILNEKAHEITYIENAALVAEGDLDPDMRLVAAEALKRSSREIYGVPNRDRALTLVHARLKKADALMQSDNPELRAIGGYIAE
jgi:hypothetical protein